MPVIIDSGIKLSSELTIGSGTIPILIAPGNYYFTILNLLWRITLCSLLPTQLFTFTKTNAFGYRSFYRDDNHYAVFDMHVPIEERPGSGSFDANEDKTLIYYNGQVSSGQRRKYLIDVNVSVTENQLITYTVDNRNGAFAKSDSYYLSIINYVLYNYYSV